MTPPRPGKRRLASAAPSGAPSSSAAQLAVRLTMSESETMPVSSPSPCAMRPSAVAKAPPASSISAKGAGFAHHFRPKAAATYAKTRLGLLAERRADEEELLAFDPVGGDNGA